MGIKSYWASRRPPAQRERDWKGLKNFLFKGALGFGGFLLVSSLIRAPGSGENPLSEMLDDGKKAQEQFNEMAKRLAPADLIKLKKRVHQQRAEQIQFKLHGTYANFETFDFSKKPSPAAQYFIDKLAHTPINKMAHYSWEDRNTGNTYAVATIPVTDDLAQTQTLVCDSRAGYYTKAHLLTSGFNDEVRKVLNQRALSPSYSLSDYPNRSVKQPSCAELLNRMAPDKLKFE